MPYRYVKNFLSTLFSPQKPPHLNPTEVWGASTTASSARMLLSLNILRGVDLVAKDHNLLTANTSDPYCLVFIDGGEIGKTPVHSNTLNPIWGGPKSTCKFQGDNETKVTIEIWDMDKMSSDDRMGKISFSVGEMLKGEHSYPNEWR
eukprot:12005936-Ditylum_brightwellii.AAC.1